LNIIETARGKGDIQKAVDEIFNQNEWHHMGCFLVGTLV
jgi:hypothetical protein